jgi:hypothetical protein
LTTTDKDAIAPRPLISDSGDPVWSSAIVLFIESKRIFLGGVIGRRSVTIRPPPHGPAKKCWVRKKLIPLAFYVIVKIIILNSIERPQPIKQLFSRTEYGYINSKIKL